MSTARKRLIIARTRPVSEMASEIAEALSDVAAAICFDAATKYEGTAGEQRQIAATMFQIARLRFGGVKYDGKPIAQADIEQADKIWRAMIDGRKHR